MTVPVLDVQEQRHLWVNWFTPEGDPRGCRAPIRRVMHIARPFDVLEKGPGFKVIRQGIRQGDKYGKVQLILYKSAGPEETAEAVDAFMKHEGGSLGGWWIE